MAGQPRSSNCHRTRTTQELTPTRSSLRQREKKKAKSGDVLSTVAEVAEDDADIDSGVDVSVVDRGDDILPPPVPVQVATTTTRSDDITESVSNAR
jgi:hypothetical protein